MSELTPEQKAEIVKFFGAMGSLAGTAGKVYADKKVDMNDLPHLMSLVSDSGKIIDGLDNLDIVWDGISSMGVDEIITLLRDAFNVGLKYEESRKA